MTFGGGPTAPAVAMPAPAAMPTTMIFAPSVAAPAPAAPLAPAMVPAMAPAPAFGGPAAATAGTTASLQQVQALIQTLSAIAALVQLRDGGQMAAPQVAGGGAVAAPAPAAPAAAPVQPQSLTALASGGSASDAQLVEGTLATLRSTPAGAQIVDRLLANNAKVNVISDAQFTQMGQADAHAFFDPNIDTVYLRRSDLVKDQQMAAVELAHEGTHLLDDIAGLNKPLFAQSEARAQAMGGTTSQANEVRAQAQFEEMIISEARAFTFSGQVAKQLGYNKLTNTDPTLISATGTNDQATYARVFQALLKGPYNTENRAAQVRNF